MDVLPYVVLFHSPFLLPSFQESECSPINVCYQTRNPVHGISAFKSVSVSIIVVHELLMFIGETILNCVVTIPFKNIVNQISATLAE